MADFDFGSFVGSLAGSASSLWASKRSADRNENLSRESMTRNETLSREAMTRNEALQREMAKNGVRWRVEDARAAGLHPLVGAGMQPVQGGGISVGGTGVSPSADYRIDGQDFTRAIRATQTPAEKIHADLQLELLKSQIKETDARAYYYMNEAGRRSQSDQASTPMVGAVKPQPDRPVSRAKVDPSRSASEHPAWMKVEVMPGKFLDVPLTNEGWGESLEGQVPQIGTVLRNAQMLIDPLKRRQYGWQRRYKSHPGKW